jgi:hypothetical protein
MLQFSQNEQISPLIKLIDRYYDRLSLLFSKLNPIIIIVNKI